MHSSPRASSQPACWNPFDFFTWCSPNTAHDDLDDEDATPLIPPSPHLPAKINEIAPMPPPKPLAQSSEAAPKPPKLFPIPVLKKRRPSLQGSTDALSLHRSLLLSAQKPPSPAKPSVKRSLFPTNRNRTGTVKFCGEAQFVFVLSTGDEEWGEGQRQLIWVSGASCVC
jgi:hypothetical protein